jgi:hypothetical protein
MRTAIAPAESRKVTARSGRRLPDLTDASSVTVLVYR